MPADAVVPTTQNPFFFRSDVSVVLRKIHYGSSIENIHANANASVIGIMRPPSCVYASLEGTKQLMTRKMKVSCVVVMVPHAKPSKSAAVRNYSCLTL